MTQADPARALAARGEKDLGRGGVGVLLQKMMLNLPGIVDAESVGQLDLIEGLLKQTVFAVLSPRAGQLVFVEKFRIASRFPRLWLMYLNSEFKTLYLSRQNMTRLL